jgi:hypothetical protein
MKYLSKQEATSDDEGDGAPTESAGGKALSSPNPTPSKKRKIGCLEDPVVDGMHTD